LRKALIRKYPLNGKNISQKLKESIWFIRSTRGTIVLNSQIKMQHSQVEKYKSPISQFQNWIFSNIIVNLTNKNVFF